jgi:hypothetical protein
MRNSSVHPAHEPADHADEPLQDIVARGVTELVVDVLEAIDIEEQQRRRLAEAVAPLHGVHETRIHVPAVERASQLDL